MKTKHLMLAALCAALALSSSACSKKENSKDASKSGEAAASELNNDASDKSGDGKEAAEKDGGGAASESDASVKPEEKKAAQRQIHKDPGARDAFNRAAVRLNIPLYWLEDKNGSGTVDDDELVRLMFPEESPILDDGRIEKADEKTQKIRLNRAVLLIESWMGAPLFPKELSPEEISRRSLVVEELDQGQPILVRTDLKNADPDEKTFVEAMLEVGRNIDAIYAMQTGAAALQADLPADDLASQSLFRRNWGPKCLAPMTEKKQGCYALPSMKPLKVGLYPESIQDSDAAFCKKIEADPALASPFSIVTKDGESGALQAVPYSKAWPQRMEKVSLGLKKAAESLKKSANEEPLRNYLLAAAESFMTNDWQPADEAWAAMTGRNSKWYVRVGPDEVYWEPCSLKAGFHMTFARINPEAIAWQDKLTPKRQEMENELAQIAGAPYEARQVSFQLPDFIDIVLNAGDDRDAFGATIGQSLPNWGPVANEGRGRTVAMSNLYTDAVSLKNRRDGASSLFDEATMTSYTDSASPGLLSTILHEASHNLGPAHEYKVDGKVDNDVFGGPMASTAEELKAQTAALWFIEKLLKEGLITEKESREDYVDAITWAFGHISRGMFDGSGRPKHYSQLAAIQVGFLMDEGAVSFDASALAANGRDKGAFTIHFDKMPAAAAKLMKVVAGLKARGDKAAMESLIQRYVTGDKVPQALITERLLRYPKASFVYAIEL